MPWSFLIGLPSFILVVLAFSGWEWEPRAERVLDGVRHRLERFRDSPMEDRGRFIMRSLAWTCGVTFCLGSLVSFNPLIGLVLAVAIPLPLTAFAIVFCMLTYRLLYVWAFIDRHPKGTMGVIGVGGATFSLFALLLTG